MRRSSVPDWTVGSRHFQQCHAAFLEANYEEDLLINGRYPVYLKKRISGNKGHLSNQQALELFNRYKPEFMSHLLLSHLSKDNNRPDLVKALFEPHAGQTKIIVASRYEESAVYEIGDTFYGKETSGRLQVRQASLF